jgi:hypothetical protein
MTCPPSFCGQSCSWKNKQGYEIEKNILYQDNKSTILLERNGKRSLSKQTWALNIRYFFLRTDQIEKGNQIVEYCPTTKMDADYFSKALHGKLFQKFQKSIMRHRVLSLYQRQWEECVGTNNMHYMRLDNLLLTSHVLATCDMSY